MNIPPYWRVALQLKCPRCGEGDLYSRKLSFTLRQSCSSCGLDFSKNDSADGPAVFLIFLLGFLIVPIAVIADFKYHWPMLIHLLVWPLVMAGMAALLLPPLKSLVIAIQYHHRAIDWDE
jgi:uncharacterized protein (DUF983 family)